MNSNMNSNNSLSEQTLQKYDIIPNAGLESKYINKSHKLVVSLTHEDASNPIILNKIFKDVVSVKLLHAIIIIAAPDDSSVAADASIDSIPTYITLSIKELNNIYSTSIPSGNTLLTSFSTIEYDSTYNREQNGTDEKVNIYKTKFLKSQDIKYFDPPLNSLGQLNISLFENNTTNIISGGSRALAGAGGTAAFTAYSSTLHSGWPLSGLYDNIISKKSTDSSITTVLGPTTQYPEPFVAYEFYIPQIITKYRIWGRSEGSTSGHGTQNAKNWQLRAAVDKATYDDGNGVYTVLDTQTDAAFSFWTGSNLTASDNFDKSNEYNITNVNSYRYYVLYITANNSNGATTLAEWALYSNPYTCKLDFIVETKEKQRVY